MLSVLRDRTYRRLFAAQVVALLGTGLATVALALLAYDLAGSDASGVLGTAFALKMTAYVGIAPLATALAACVPVRALLVAMDLLRAGVALALPFVGEVWQVYALILLLQAASATFTPAFQAVIPVVLPGERDYTRALSLSRLAYDLENVCSPALAAALLSVVTYGWLFAGTTVGFVASAVLVWSCVLPPRVGAGRTGAGSRVGAVFGRAAFGVRLIWGTPRLRALLGLDLAVAAAGSMVLVNTVVLVRDELGRGVRDVSLALGAYGAGSMAVALLLPVLLERVRDRTVMLLAGCVVPGVFVGWVLLTGVLPVGAGWPVLWVCWLAFGCACSAILTPAGRLVRRSTREGDLPTVFAARFSLTHLCWLLTYPLAGWLAVAAGTATAAWVLGAVALAGACAAAFVWPAGDHTRLEHHHRQLPPDHPHLALARRVPGGYQHAHEYVIDELHPRWPARSGS